MEVELREQALTAACRNCGRPTGENDERFCGGCGQRHLEGRLTIPMLWRELQDRFFERGLFRTLFDAVRSPGGVIRRYVDGQRRRYLTPVSYLLFGVALSLLLFGYVRGETFDPQMKEGWAPIAEALSWTDAQLDSLVEANNWITKNSAIFSLLMALPFILLVRLFFPRGQITLAESAVFGLYAFGHAFFADLLTLGVYLFTDDIQIQVWLTLLIFVVALAVSAWGYFPRRVWATIKVVVAYVLSFWIYSICLAVGLIFYVTKQGGVGP